MSSDAAEGVNVDIVAGAEVGPGLPVFSGEASSRLLRGRGRIGRELGPATASCGLNMVSRR